MSVLKNYIVIFITILTLILILSSIKNRLAIYVLNIGIKAIIIF